MRELPNQTHTRRPPSPRQGHPLCLIAIDDARLHHIGGPPWILYHLIAFGGEATPRSSRDTAWLSGCITDLKEDRACRRRRSMEAVTGQQVRIPNIGCAAAEEQADQKTDEGAFPHDRAPERIQSGVPVRRIRGAILLEWGRFQSRKPSSCEKSSPKICGYLC